MYLLCVPHLPHQYDNDNNNNINRNEKGQTMVSNDRAIVSQGVEHNTYKLWLLFPGNNKNLISFHLVSYFFFYFSLHLNTWLFSYEYYVLNWNVKKGYFRLLFDGFEKKVFLQGGPPSCSSTNCRTSFQLRGLSACSEITDVPISCFMRAHQRLNVSKPSVILSPSVRPAFGLLRAKCCNFICCFYICSHSAQRRYIYILCIHLLVDFFVVLCWMATDAVLI